MDRGHFDPRISEDNACEEDKVLEVAEFGKECIPCEGDLQGLATEDPGQSECDDEKARQKNSRDRAEGAQPPRGLDAEKIEQSGPPEADEDDEDVVAFIGRKFGINEIREGACNECKGRRIPDEILRPEKPNGQKSPLMSKSLLDPDKDPAPFGIGGGKFCGNEGDGDKEAKGGKQQVEEGRESKFSDGWPILDAAKGRDVDHHEHEDIERRATCHVRSPMRFLGSLRSGMRGRSSPIWYFSARS